MKTRYDLAVVIGRFQPIHKGHVPAFKKAYHIADKTVCVIGSANKPATPKNPFSVDQRIAMIDTVLYSENIKSETIEYVAVEDTFYLEQQWFRRVKDEVAKIADQVLYEKRKSLRPVYDCFVKSLKEYEIDANDKHQLKLYLSLHGHYTVESTLILNFQRFVKKMKTCEIAVLGHLKDDSSYYLNNFSDWEKVDIGPWIACGDNPQYPISATDIRDLWFGGKLSYTESNLHKSTFNTLLEWPRNEVLDLTDDWNFIERYKKDTQLGKYPVQFLTTDAVVMHGDEVLMIRRGMSPGKGQWALPGGFKNHKETFFNSCIRELKEETRIDVPEKVIRGSLIEEKMFDFPERSSRGTTVTMAYSFKLDPTRARPRVKGGDDAVMAWWFPLSDLLKMRDQIYEDHLDIIEYMTSRV